MCYPVKNISDLLQTLLLYPHNSGFNGFFFGCFFLIPLDMFVWDRDRIWVCVFLLERSLIVCVLCVRLQAYFHISCGCFMSINDLSTIALCVYMNVNPHVGWFKHWPQVGFSVQSVWYMSAQCLSSALNNSSFYSSVFLSLMFLQLSKVTMSQWDRVCCHWTLQLPPSSQPPPGLETKLGIKANMEVIMVLELHPELGLRVKCLQFGLKQKQECTLRQVAKS